MCINVTYCLRCCFLHGCRLSIQPFCRRLTSPSRTITGCTFDRLSRGVCTLQSLPNPVPENFRVGKRCTWIHVYSIHDIYYTFTLIYCLTHTDYNILHCSTLLEQMKGALYSSQTSVPLSWYVGWQVHKGIQVWCVIFNNDKLFGYLQKQTGRDPSGMLTTVTCAGTSFQPG